MMMELQLYYLDGCPYCKKVIRFLENEQIAVDYKNIGTDSEASQELQRIGGKRQVPCLVIDNRQPLYESDDIIAWLKANRDRVS